MKTTELSKLKIGEHKIVAGHSTIMFASKKADYREALKDLKKHIEYDREEDGNNGDWQGVSGDPKKREAGSWKEAEQWAYDNVSDYAFYAIEIRGATGGEELKTQLSTVNKLLGILSSIDKESPFVKIQSKLADLAKTTEDELKKMPQGAVGWLFAADIHH